MRLFNSCCLESPLEMLVYGFRTQHAFFMRYVLVNIVFVEYSPCKLPTIISGTGTSILDGTLAIVLWSTWVLLSSGPDAKQGCLLVYETSSVAWL